MKFKYLILLVVNISIVSAGAYADRLDADGILRKDDGSIIYMDHFDALNACPNGTHLPTVRELALDAQARGAQGVLEAGQGSVPSRYDMIASINPDGFKDIFYFNFDDYSRPLGDSYKVWFWSSSIGSSYTTAAYHIHGGSGDIASTWRGGVFHAVRCFPDQAPKP